MKEQKQRGSARTQPATRDEPWSDERVKGFLGLQPPEGMPAEYNMLLKAYRGMTAPLFQRFVGFYVAAGHDINVRLEDGSTFLDLVRQHRCSEEYAEILSKAGGTAKKSG